MCAAGRTAAGSTRRSRARASKNAGDRRLGELLGRIVGKGVTRQDIVELLELARREAVFGVIHMVEEEGLEPDAWEGIHEAFDGADPAEFDAPGAAKGRNGPPARAAGPVLTLRQSHHVAFSPDGTRVVAAAGGRIWDLATAKEVGRCELPPHTGAVAWSPAGKLIAAMSTTGAVRLCDANTGKAVTQVKMTGEGNAPAFGPGGKVLYAGDWDGNLFAWSVPAGKLLHRREIGKMIDAVAAARDAVAVLCGNIAIGFDPALKTERWRAPAGGVGSGCLRLAGKRRLLVGWKGNRLVAFALDTRKVVARADPKVEAKKHPKATAVSPDGRHFCAVHGDDFILFDASLRERGRRRIEYAHSATFSPDARLVALSSWGEGEIWRVEASPNEDGQAERF